MDRKLYLAKTAKYNSLEPFRSNTCYTYQGRYEATILGQVQTASAVYDQKLPTVTVPKFDSYNLGGDTYIDNAEHKFKLNGQLSCLVAHPRTFRLQM